jgi:hypothetical protein
MPAPARFGRRVYISAEGRPFRFSTLAGRLLLLLKVILVKLEIFQKKGEEIQ